MYTYTYCTRLPGSRMLQIPSPHSPSLIVTAPLTHLFHHAADRRIHDIQALLHVHIIVLTSQNGLQKVFLWYIFKVQK